MSKIRINEFARELEVKPNRILELLPEFGVEEKKTSLQLYRRGRRDRDQGKLGHFGLGLRFPRRTGRLSGAVARRRRVTEEPIKA